MVTIPGYKITNELYTSRKTVVYRGIYEESGQPVIIKLPQADYPDLKTITKYHHEYEVASSLTSAGIVKAYVLGNYNNRPFLILEDFGGDSLTRFIHAQKMGLGLFLRMAVRLCEILDDIHKANLIHKDIKPQNIIVNPETDQIKLSGFGISSYLPSETPETLEGTLAYMSPEQTGRMNRVVDYRTDFYSLGVTFYEMLTGQVPFQTSDPI